MRVLQLIDSLHAGGAERMAVNLANALSKKVERSFLCATREEGLLINSINKNIEYLYLKKKSTFDFRAIKRLYKFVRINQISIIHAHSTSFFLAAIIKMLNPKIEILWHDHYGNSEFLNERQNKILRFCSKYFTQILCVNETLRKWSKENLKCKKVNYLANFAILDNEVVRTRLKGEGGKRILHLANLRQQKDHHNLFMAFKTVLRKYPSSTLHCVGKDFKDSYSNELRVQLRDLNIENNVFFYGSQNDVANIISQSFMGVLSSKSEGLPIALLEYGLSGKPVVVTNVGDCTQVIEDGLNGLVVPKQDSKALSLGIISLFENHREAISYGVKLKTKVENKFSCDAYIDQLMLIYSSLNA